MDIENIAERAAMWWTDQLRGGALQDNGDPMTMVFASLVQDTQGKIPEEKLVVFNRSLQLLVYAKLMLSDRLTLACDYGAGPVLSDAARGADISDMCPPFPMKTVMWIAPGRIQVALGYRAKPRTIWGECVDTGEPA